MGNADAAVTSGAHSGQTRLLEKRADGWYDGERGPFATPRDAYAARLDVCKYCGGFDGHHFIWCYRPRGDLIEYRGYTITQAYSDGQPDAWRFTHRDYDGPESKRCGAAPTLEAAAAEIDEIEGPPPRGSYPVFLREPR